MLVFPSHCVGSSMGGTTPLLVGPRQPFQSLELAISTSVMASPLAVAEISFTGFFFSAPGDQHGERDKQADENSHRTLWV